MTSPAETPKPLRFATKGLASLKIGDEVLLCEVGHHPFPAKVLGTFYAEANGSVTDQVMVHNGDALLFFDRATGDNAKHPGWYIRKRAK